MKMNHFFLLLSVAVCSICVLSEYTETPRELRVPSVHRLRLGLAWSPSAIHQRGFSVCVGSIIEIGIMVPLQFVIMNFNTCLYSSLNSTRSEHCNTQPRGK